VVIDFFELDTREELIRERADVLVKLFIAHDLRSTSPSPQRRQLAERSLDLMTSPRSPHTSCARSFRSLLERDPVRAQELAEAAQAYLDSQS
jgi:hypothetical protein